MLSWQNLLNAFLFWNVKFCGLQLLGVSSLKLELICLDNTFNTIVIYVEAYVCRLSKLLLEDSLTVFVTLIYKITEADDLQKKDKWNVFPPSSKKSQLEDKTTRLTWLVRDRVEWLRWHVIVRDRRGCWLTVRSVVWGRLNCCRLAELRL